MVINVSQMFFLLNWESSRDVIDMASWFVFATMVTWSYYIPDFLHFLFRVETNWGNLKLLSWELNLPIELDAPLQTMAKIAPTSPPPAVNNWNPAASHLVNPDLSRIAKSPTSCGISWTKIAIVVRTPRLGDTRKAPPKDRPCVKLSMTLASRFKYPDTYMEKQKNNNPTTNVSLLPTYSFFVHFKGTEHFLQGNKGDESTQNEHPAWLLRPLSKSKHVLEPSLLHSIYLYGIMLSKCIVGSSWVKENIINSTSWPAVQVYANNFLNLTSMWGIDGVYLRQGMEKNVCKQGAYRKAQYCLQLAGNHCNRTKQKSLNISHKYIKMHKRLLLLLLEQTRHKFHLKHF